MTYRQRCPQLTMTVEFVLNLPTGNIILGRSKTAPLGPTFVEPTTKVIWEAEEAGQYTICAIIDPDNEVVETNESNNEICRTVTVLDQVPDVMMWQQKTLHLTPAVG
jgi:subtilase family serine protease